jgi:hypothetical protein
LSIEEVKIPFISAWGRFMFLYICAIPHPTKEYEKRKTVK